MAVPYHAQHRQLQDRFDTRRLADRLNARLATCHIDAEDRAFIESRDMFFIATVDHRGVPTCSYKGGDPGFVRVLGPDHVCFPLYDGNGMFLTAGNLARHPDVGLLFIAFDRPRRLRIHGEARLVDDAELVASYPGALAVVTVRVSEVFQNCSRYVHRYERRERSASIPDADGTAPHADWKRTAWAVTVLPAGDPANSAWHRARARILTAAAFLVGRKPGRYTR
jgi:predicted pyridoxine 5'-phosphate oxidase superfamily flavin-nucleotide-binding protein